MARSLYRAWPVHLRMGLLAFGLLAGLASAPAQAGGQRKALVLSVTEDNHQSEALRTALGELVERTGAQLVVPVGLSAGARGCEDPRCLTALSKEHGVDVIIAARLQRQSKLERIVDVWAFEESSGRDASERDLCDARDLKDCLSDLGARVLGKLSTAATPRPAPSSPPPAAPSAGLEPGVGAAAELGSPAAQAPKGGPTGVPSGRSPGLPTWRKGLGVGLAGLGLAGLAVGIGASAKHGGEGPMQCPSGSEIDCRYSMTPLFAPAFALAAAASVAALLTFTLPTPRSAKKESSR